MRTSHSVGVALESIQYNPPPYQGGARGGFIFN